MTSAEYWAENQVGGPYFTLEESQAALAERQALYPKLYELMPVNLPGETVFDFGCGPGHDVLLFLQGGAKRVLYYDASPKARNIVRERLELHGVTNRVEYTVTTGAGEIGHIHCSGVLHHMAAPMEALRAFRKALRKGGEARVMIYDGSNSEHSQSDVPITYWWTQGDFKMMFQAAGFDGEYVGGYECSAPWRPNCITSCWRLW